MGEMLADRDTQIVRWQGRARRANNEGGKELDAAMKTNLTMRRTMLCLMLGGGACDAGPAADEAPLARQDEPPVVTATSALATSIACTPTDPRLGVACPLGYTPRLFGGVFTCSREVLQIPQDHEVECPFSEYGVRHGEDVCLFGGRELPTTPCRPGFRRELRSPYSYRDRCLRNAEFSYVYPLGCEGPTPQNGVTCPDGATGVLADGRFHCELSHPPVAEPPICFPFGGLQIQPGPDECSSGGTPQCWFGRFVIDYQGDADRCVLPRLLPTEYPPPVLAH